MHKKAFYEGHDQALWLEKTRSGFRFHPEDNHIRGCVYGERIWDIPEMPMQQPEGVNDDDRQVSGGSSGSTLPR